MSLPYGPTVEYRKTYLGPRHQLSAYVLPVAQVVALQATEKVHLGYVLKPTDGLFKSGFAAALFTGGRG